MMSSNESITCYDIASNEPRRTFAPNPWKTRFALNFKGVSYKTQWVHLPDISSIRQKLGVPANRTHADGTPYYTLPVIRDASTGKTIGDTFEIALYLDSTYQNDRKLFGPLNIGLTAAFNAQVDALFTKYVILVGQMPFDPIVADEIRDIFVKRAASMNVANLQLSDEQREQMFVAFEASLGELAKAYKHTGGTTDWVWRTGGTSKAQSQRSPESRSQVSVFLDGDEPAYADFIVGGWLKMLETCLGVEDWRRVRSWHDGLWGRIVDALKPWSEIK